LVDTFVVTWENLTPNYITKLSLQILEKDGSLLGYENNINSNEDLDQKDPEIAADGEGNFIISWLTVDLDQNVSVNARKFDPAGFYASDTLDVDHLSLNVGTRISVDMSDDGDSIVAWDRWDSFGADVHARKIDNLGNFITDPFIVNTTTEGNQYSPDIAMLDRNNFAVTWTVNEPMEGVQGNIRDIKLRIFEDEEPPDEDILLNLKIDPDFDSFSPGDRLSLELSLFAPPEDTPVDLWWGLQKVGGPICTAKMWFPGVVEPFIKNVTIPANTELKDATLLDTQVPTEIPPINESGTYVFAFAATDPGTANLKSNIALATFEYKFD